MTAHVRFAREHFVGLPAGAVIAIVWANAASVSYFRAAQALAFVVNDVGVALMLAYLAQEVVEALLPGGVLTPWRRSLLPIVAGAGGTLAAMAVYAAYIHAGDEEALALGWPIAGGLDVVFCLAIARGIFRRDAPVTFLLLLAIAGDVIGLALLSGHLPPPRVHPAAVLLIVLAIGASIAFRRAGIRSVWPYLGVAGSCSWLGCYLSGVHPALALLPIVPFVPHAPRQVGAVGRVDVGGVHRTGRHLEDILEYPVQAIAFLFGLVNAGVLLRGFGTGTWAVLLAGLIGRPAGVIIAAALASAAGLSLPRGMGWRELAVIALAVSPSLAFGLFMAAAVFPDGPLLTETKMGAIATVLGVLVALSAARLLRVGRFGRLATSSQYASTPWAGKRA